MRPIIASSSTILGQEYVFRVIQVRIWRGKNVVDNLRVVYVRLSLNVVPELTLGSRSTRIARGI